MHAPSTSLTLLQALAVLACSVAAQQLRPTFCQVVDEAGAAVVGAEVTLVGGQPGLSADLQEGHVVEVVTGKRGRVLARLRSGLCYAAWAKGPVVDGQRASAAVVGYFAAGAVIELRCGAPAPTQTCRVTGADAWSDGARLRYVAAMNAIPGTERELEVGADGSFDAPGAPFDWFEVRSPDGQPLWGARMEARLELPPPQRVQVRAVDERGGPLAGAEVAHRVTPGISWRVDGLRSVGQDRMRALGVTDAEGRCDVIVPYDGDPLQAPTQDLLLFVTAGDRPPVAGGVWGGRYYVSGHRVAEIKGGELRFDCPAVAPLYGAVPGAPRGTVAHLSAICKLHLRRDSYLHDARVFTAEVESDGSFVFVDVPEELHSCRLSFVAPAGVDWQPPVYPPEARRALPADVVARLDTQEPLDFGEVSLQVIDATGGPARGAVALLSSAERRGVLLRDSLLRAPLDERGQARLRMQPGKWVVVVVTADGFGGEPLEVGAAGGAFEMRLQPLARTRVTLIDERDAPVVGARVQSRGTSTRGTNDPVRSLLQGLRVTTHAQWGALRTDEQGRVEVPFVPVEGVRQRIELTWGDRRSEEVELEPGGQVTARAR